MVDRIELEPYRQAPDDQVGAAAGMDGCAEGYKSRQTSIQRGPVPRLHLYPGQASEGSERVESDRVVGRVVRATSDPLVGVRGFGRLACSTRCSTTSAP